MTLFSKKIIKKVAAGMAIVSMLTPTVFAQTAPPIPLPPVVVTAQRIYDGAAYAAWNAMQSQMMMDQMAADAAFLAQLQQTDGANNTGPDFSDVSGHANQAGVFTVSDKFDSATARSVAAQNSIAPGKWFSLCDGSPPCTHWFRNTGISVAPCSPSTCT